MSAGAEPKTICRMTPHRSLAVRGADSAEGKPDMSPIVIKVMFALGIVGHALNLYCDYLLSVTPLPLWMVVFTVLPVFIIMAPSHIIGTLHISAAVSMLAWLIIV